MYLNSLPIFRISDYRYTLELLSKLFPKEFVEKFQLLVQYYKNTETLLYLNSPFYRDNFSHMIKVSIMGYKILNFEFELGRRRSLLDYLAEITGYDESFILKIWFVSSLFHDIVQPIEKLTVAPLLKIPPYNEIIGDIYEFEKKVILKIKDKKILNEYFKMISKYLNNKILRKIKKEIIRKSANDHGFFSSFTLYLIAKNGNLLNTEYKNIFLISCVSILLHNYLKELEWPDKYFNIRDIPLHFFFFLIDNLQESGRKVENIKNINFELIDIMNYQVLNYRTDCIECIYRYTDKEMIINAGFDFRKHIGDKYDKNSNQPKFLKVFSKKDIYFPIIHLKYFYYDPATDKVIECKYLY